MARAIWSGTVSFGLVSVPVRMVAATELKELRFHFLHKKNGSYSPIGYDKIDRESGESVEPDDIVRGFEVLSGHFEPSEYDDEYRKELLDLIHAKAEGAPLPEPEEANEGEVVDLMEALRASVEQTKKQRARRPRAKKAS